VIRRIQMSKQLVARAELRVALPAPVLVLLLHQLTLQRRHRLSLRLRRRDLVADVHRLALGLQAPLFGTI
jgi:hypothetical protein